MTLEERINVLRKLKMECVVYGNIYSNPSVKKMYQQYAEALTGAMEDCKAKLRRDGESNG